MQSILIIDGKPIAHTDSTNENAYNDLLDIAWQKIGPISIGESVATAKHFGNAAELARKVFDVHSGIYASDALPLCDTNGKKHSVFVLTSPKYLHKLENDLWDGDYFRGMHQDIEKYCRENNIPTD